MGHYKQQEVDFIKRTIKIIDQYDKHLPEDEVKYNVTLFINCMVGLLIIPQQHWYNSLPDLEINNGDWGISPEMIKNSSNRITVKTVATHLRNSIAHYRFVSLPNDKDILDSFKFIDKNPQNKVTFDADITFKALRKFVSKLTDEFLEFMKAEE